MVGSIRGRSRSPALIEDNLDAGQSRRGWNIVSLAIGVFKDSALNGSMALEQEKGGRSRKVMSQRNRVERADVGNLPWKLGAVLGQRNRQVVGDAYALRDREPM